MMQRSSLMSLLAVIVILMITISSEAAEHDEFGFGLVLGEPTGLNGQFFWSKDAAIDVTAAWSLGDWLMLAADFQVYNYLLDAPREWRWYYGIGTYLAFPEHKDEQLGVRLPLGIRYHFPHSRMDIWAEIDPAMELIDNTEAKLQGGIGLTFWIK